LQNPLAESRADFRFLHTVSSRMWFNHPMTGLRYPDIFFDWGDTVMYDDPAQTAPMVAWPEVCAVPGIAAVLEVLQVSGRRISLATSANISDETQIWAALECVDLDRFFDKIYCFENTGLPKGEAFYRHILSNLQIDAADALMIGDHLEKDVLTPNRLEINAVWFNERSTEEYASELAATVHNMQQLWSFFESLDHLH
jgi:FMN phosphatase YigB (HAD superfamily)